MSKAETTAQKRNAYRIRATVSEAIFGGLRVAQGDEVLKETAVARFGMPLISTLANIATRAIMNEPRLNVVLKKK